MSLAAIIRLGFRSESNFLCSRNSARRATIELGTKEKEKLWHIRWDGERHIMFGARRNCSTAFTCSLKKTFYGTRRLFSRRARSSSSCAAAIQFRLSYDDDDDRVALHIDTSQSTLRFRQISDAFFCGFLANWNCVKISLAMLRWEIGLGEVRYDGLEYWNWKTLTVCLDSH